jgi:hypothetical protein
MRHCYTCIHWLWRADHQGNCTRSPWTNDKYAEDATPESMACTAYVDKYGVREYDTEVASAKET